MSFPRTTDYWERNVTKVIPPLVRKVRKNSPRCISWRDKEIKVDHVLKRIYALNWIPNGQARSATNKLPLYPKGTEATTLTLVASTKQRTTLEGHHQTRAPEDHPLVLSTSDNSTNKITQESHYEPRSGHKHIANST